MSSLDDLLPKPGDVIAGKYLLESTLGTGGMGAVFEVTHRVTGKRFAVKWLLPRLTDEADAAKRFIREAQVAGRIEHKNVVEVYDVGQQGDSSYMVMELLRGESLADCLAREGPLDGGRACRIVIPILRGLAAAHKAGIVHRDLKPDNIFLCRQDGSSEVVPKVLDFGISKMSQEQGEVASSITRTGMVMGTPHYMSPEQVRAKSVDARTDVYAMGVILYELLSTEYPFPGDSYSDLVLRIMTETPRPLTELSPGVPPALCDVISRAMAREPDDRFESAEALAQALEPFATGMLFDTGAHPLAASADSLRGPAQTTTETPLATESGALRSATTTRTRGVPVGLIAGLGLAAVAVLGLGSAALFMAGDDRADKAGVSGAEEASSGVRPAEPPTAPPEQPTTILDPAAYPEPTTVRIDGKPMLPAGKAPPALADPDAGVDRPATPQTATPAVDRVATKREPHRSVSARKPKTRPSKRPRKPRPVADPPKPSAPAAKTRGNVDLNMDDFL